MFDIRYVAGFGDEPGPWSMVTVLIPVAAGGRDLLLAGSMAAGRYHLLEPGDPAIHLASQGMTGRGAVFALSDAALVDLAGQMRVYGASRGADRIEIHRVAADGRLSAIGTIAEVGGVAMKVSAIEAVTLGGVPHLVTAGHGRATVELIRLGGDGVPALAARVADTPKTALDGISEMVSLTIGGEVFLVAASEREDGLTSFHLGAGGTMALADTLTPKDGLWVSGVNALAAVAAHGDAWLVAGSVLAGSLTLIRINHLGVMFPSHHLLDTRATRFGAVEKIVPVAVGERVFLIAGGGEGGLSLLELLPGGHLFHHRAVLPEGELAALAQGITGLSATVGGDWITIFAGTPGGLAQLAIPLAGIGPAILGTPAVEVLRGTGAGDLIVSGGGADTLHGGAGDDLLVAGAAGVTFWGGAGADVFRVGAGTAVSVIRDFEPGIDRIDLSQWGRIHHPSALEIRARGDGAELAFGDNLLRIHKEGGGRIEPGFWSLDDFLF